MSTMFGAIVRFLVVLAAAAAIAPAASAQTTAAQTPAAAAPAPTPAWTGSAGLGFSMNRGNTATTNLNVTFDATSDTKKKDAWKFKSVYMRDKTDGSLSADRLVFDGRYERTISKRWYGFAALGFLEDEFKQIDYLWAPTAGIGYKLVATDTTTLNTDAGLGVKIEKNPGSDATTDMGVTLGDKFAHKLSKDSALTQSFNALWKADEFADGVYTFSAGVAAALTKKIAVKVDLLDAYITRPPTSDVKKNDVSLITSFAYKF
jgi:putative salt-induced outer membrane protein YdiY